MTGLGLRELDPRDEKVVVDDETKDEPRIGGGSGPKLLCKLCRGPITTRSDAVNVEGKHEHTFFNPSGILYEIGCFGLAPGCKVSGLPTEEFAWFKGFHWQYSSCRFCETHLGWYFTRSGAGAGFHGLILNRLVELDQPKDPG